MARHLRNIHATLVLSEDKLSKYPTKHRVYSASYAYLQIFENSKMLEIDKETAGDVCSDKAQGSDRVQGRNSISSRNLCKLLQTIRSEESRVKAGGLKIDSPGFFPPPPPQPPPPWGVPSSSPLPFPMKRLSEG